jgi:hypothetical protein
LSPTDRLKTAAPLCVLILLFIALGWPFVTRLGIEVDEALVGNGIYERAAPWYSWHLFGHEIPVMLLYYLGALKTWMYNGIFAIWPPGPVSLRLPMVLIAAASIVVQFLFIDRILGRAAAWLSCALVATDPSFILSTAIDYGPIAVEHSLKMAALLLLVKFHSGRSRFHLAAAFFLFGLAMWDKAVFSWILAGLAVGALVVFRREVFEYINARNILTAAGSFITGALPLIIYNIARPFETFSSTAKFSLEGAFVKLVLLKRTLDGSGMFGFLTAPDAGPNPGAPHSIVQRLAFWISGVSGSPTATFSGIALVIAILAIPFIWRTPARRPVLFFLIAAVVIWLQMFFTTGAGGATHHVILLWPFPAVIVAAVAATLMPKRALAAAGVVLCASQLLVMNQHLVVLIRNGSSVRWTDAFAPLTKKLSAGRAKRLITCDWGILETLNLLSEGELPVEDASASLRPLTTDNRQLTTQITQRFEGRDTLWVLHSEGHEQWPGVNAALDQTAASAGYSKEVLESIHDRNGRPIFDIVRFRR